jgi:flavin-binding protein dodecin
LVVGLSFTTAATGDDRMAENNVYKKIEVVGSSKKSLTDAIKVAVARAAETVKNMSWFEVVEQRGAIRDGKVAEYQVTVKIGFRVDQ